MAFERSPKEWWLVMTSGKTTPDLVIVTGAGSGIGRAVAIRLATEGYKCVLVGRRKERLEQTASMCKQPGDATIVVPVDITTEEGRAALLRIVDSESAALYGLVNNAGGSYRAPIFDQELQKWRESWILNVEAPTFLCFDAMMRMRDFGEGSIVNIASIYGIVALNPAHYDDARGHSTLGPKRGVAYAAAKGALRTLAKELAIAGAEIGVRVNTVSPGMIRVEKQSITEERMRRLCTATPLRRMGTPIEVANAVQFFMSREAGFVTGAELVVDGGWTLW